MGLKEKAHQKWRKMQYGKQNRILRGRGILGDGTGAVRVPYRPDMVYIRLNADQKKIWKVFNDTVADIDSLPVIIEQMPDTDIWRVVEIDRGVVSYAGSGWDGVKLTQTHGEEHEWPDFTPGPDVVNTFSRAFVPLRTEPTTPSYSMDVYIRPYVYTYDNQIVEFEGDTINLATYVPNSGIRIAITYLDVRDNTVHTIAGAPVAYEADANPPSPYLPWFAKPSALVTLRQNQDIITESDVRSVGDIYHDVGQRHNLQATSDPGTGDDYSLGYSPGAIWINSSSGDVFVNTSAAIGAATWASVSNSTSQTWPGPNEILIGNTSYATISAAIAAASSGDQIKVGPGTYTYTDLTLPTGVDILGSGMDVTIFDINAGGITGSAAGGISTVQDCTFQASSRSTTGLGIRVQDASTWINVRFSVTLAATGITYQAISVLSAIAQPASFIDCVVEVDGASLATTSGGAMDIATFDKAIIYGGSYRCFDCATINESIGTGASSEVQFFNAPYLEGDAHPDSSAVSGIYQRDDMFVPIVGAWPGAGEITIDQVNYATISAAAAAASSGDQIKLGPGTFAVNDVAIPNGVDILGSGIDVTVLNMNGSTTYGLFLTASMLKDFTIQDTSWTGTSGTAFLTGGASIFESVKVDITFGDATTGFTAFSLNGIGVTAYLIDCDVTVNGASLSATSTVGVNCGNSGVGCRIIGGSYRAINGTTFNWGIQAGAGRDIELYNVPFIDADVGYEIPGLGASTAGAYMTPNGLALYGADWNGELVLDDDQDTTIRSSVDDQIDFKTGGSDRVVIDSSSMTISHQMKVTNQVALSPMNIQLRSGPPPTPSNYDIYLDDGTNTVSSYPRFKIYHNGLWQDLGN